MQLFSRNKAIVALSLGALALGACGDDVTVPVAPLAPVVISITPPSALMNVGESVNFAVQISGGSTSSVPTLASCSSSAATVATATVAGSSCRVTAIAAGNATITAAASTGQVTAASVAVAAPAPAITALAVSPSAAQLAVGSSLTVVPTVNRANASVTVVYTYTSSTAAVATVSAAGMVTAVAPGTTTITVSAAGTGTGFAAATLTSAATITVSDRAPGLTSLQVSPATASLTVGGTQSVTASAQGPRAAAATMTYGTSAPAIATVSATGVITAVAAGTATITVTAQSTQDGAFAASSLTGLVTVTVSNLAVVSINISALTQGPTTTSYASANGVSGIVSAANAQVGQPIDINNTRDQIQMTATLATNGARVDSVVAYVANADGTNRTSVGSQSYPSGGSSGALSLYINTADFTADFTAGTAAVKFANGPKLISVSAFSGATELQSTNSQTVSFNNVDGYASRATAPATSATNSAGQVWFGGPDSLTTRLGSATIVPVFYTAGRTLNNITVSMRQGAGGETLACSEFLVFQTGPYKFVYGGAKAVAGDTTVVNCSTLESAADHVVGVSAATDNNGTPAPTTSYAGGFRTSTTVAAPVARKLDFVAPTLTAIVNKPALPADTSSTWLNGSYSFAAKTAISTDAGVGASPITGRVWQYLGCGVGSTATTPATYVTFDGTTSAIAECASSTSASVYTVRYTDTDLVGNSASATATFGIDKTLPVIAWAGSTADTVTTSGVSSFTASVNDGKSGLKTEGSVYGYIGRFGAAYAPTGAAAASSLYPNQRKCESLAGTAWSPTPTAAGTDLTCAGDGQAYVALANPVSGSGATGTYALAAVSTVANEAMRVAVTVYDRAGNKAAGFRRALQDATAPIIVIGVNSAFTASALPSWNLTYKARRTGLVSLGLTYSSVLYRYPAVAVGTAWGSSFTPTIGNTGTGSSYSTADKPLTATQTVPMPAPFMLGVSLAGASGNAYDPLATVATQAFSVTATACSTCGLDTYISSSIPSPVALTSTTAIAGTFTVSASLAAANNAGAGLKAALVGSATTSANPFVRVDFYIENSGSYDYVGSSTSAATAISTAGIPTYTWLIDSYAAVDYAGTTITPARSQQTYRAIGIRANGGGDRATNATINGAILNIVTIAPVGATASVLVTGPSGFSQTVTAAGIGAAVTTTLPITNFGVYTVAAGTTNTVDGLAYVPNNASQTVTVSGNGIFAPASTITYTLNSNLIDLSITGLPDGVSTTVTASKTGEASVTAVVTGTGSTITRTIAVPSAGTGATGYTITATASMTDATTALVYTRGTLSSGTCDGITVTYGGAAANAGSPCVVPYTQTAYYTPLAIALATGVPTTLTPSVTLTPTTGTAKTITKVQTATNVIWSSGASAVDPGATVVTVAPQTISGITYGSPAVANATPAQSAPSTTTVTYSAAKATVVFSGTHIADLAGYTAPIILVGPLGEQLVNAAGAVGTTATTAQTLAIAGTYSVKAIPNITIGSSVYSFATSFVAATYGSTSALVVTVTRTQAAVNAINGVMTTNASAGTTAPMAITVVRAVTYGSLIGLTGPAATVTFTCTSSNTSLITVAMTAPAGVPTCTMTAVDTNSPAITGAANVTITLIATGGGAASLIANVIDSTLVISRTP